MERFYAKQELLNILSEDIENQIDYTRFAKRKRGDSRKVPHEMGSICGLRDSCAHESVSHAVGADNNKHMRRKIASAYIKSVKSKKSGYDGGSDIRDMNKMLNAAGHHGREVNVKKLARVHKDEDGTTRMATRYTAGQIARKFPNHNFIALTQGADDGGDHAFNIKHGTVRDKWDIADHDTPVFGLLHIKRGIEPQQKKLPILGRARNDMLHQKEMEAIRRRGSSPLTAYLQKRKAIKNHR